MQDVVLHGGTPKPGRPGEHLAPVDLAATQQELSEKIGREATRTELMSYLMYPEVFLHFDRAQDAYSDLSVLPTPEFFYGMEPRSEITIEIEEGKSSSSSSSRSARRTRMEPARCSSNSMANRAKSRYSTSH